MGWKDKTKGATLPERIVQIVTRGSLAAEHEQITEQLEQSKGSSLASSGDLRARLADIEQEMRDSSVSALLRALPRNRRPGDTRPTWRELADAHPPRLDGDGVMEARDRLAGGINYQTFPEAMVRACIVELDGEAVSLDDADWQELMSAVAQGQFDELVANAWEINKDKVSIPFSSGA